MHALFTGASSFTGCWFVEALVAEGFVVTATCRDPLSRYTGLAASRLGRAARVAELVEGCAFGDARFLALIAEAGPFDLLCHHGALTAGHRGTGFAVGDAVAANTQRVEAVLDALLARGCRTLLVTGTIFEADEGRSTPPTGAITAYGLAKTLSWQVLRYEAERRRMALGKLTIPHPFGPLEKPGLTTTLAQRWLAGETPLIEQPHLVRDFVHVDLLAASYARFARFLVGASATHRLAPSGYVETVADFARALRPGDAGAPRAALPARPCGRARAARRAAGPLQSRSPGRAGDGLAGGAVLGSGRHLV